MVDAYKIAARDGVTVFPTWEKAVAALPEGAKFGFNRIIDSEERLAESYYRVKDGGYWRISNAVPLKYGWVCGWAIERIYQLPEGLYHTEWRDGR